MTHHLTIAPLEETIAVEDGQTILEACLRQGIWLPYACGHGRCGTCKVSVLSGEIDQGPASSFALMDFERTEGKVLACCATLKGDVEIEAEVEDDEDALHHPIRELTARVTAIRDLTPTVKRIDLAVPELEFQPGQYVNVHVPGVGTRAFSIANPPSQNGVIELHVRRVENGAGTTYLHDTLAVGHELRVQGPFGRFFARRSRQAPQLYVAGGSGLSSIKAMILDQLERGSTTPITLIHAARSEAELYDRTVFDALAATHRSFRYVSALSDRTGGFAHEVLEKLYEGKFSGNTAYLCGPPVMVEACIRVLMKGRLFEKDIFTERFVTQGDGEAALAKSPLFKRI